MKAVVLGVIGLVFIGWWIVAGIHGVVLEDRVKVPTMTPYPIAREQFNVLDYRMCDELEKVAHELDVQEIDRVDEADGSCRLKVTADSTALDTLRNSIASHERSLRVHP